MAACIRKGKTLEDLSLEDYRAVSPLIGADVYRAIDLDACVERRTSLGGTAVPSVEKQIAAAREALGKL